MKKVALVLATVAAATVFAPEASAVPVFARQTGMACSACHYQHFPLLNGFGRAFKAAGFTMMGAQGKVESEEGTGLSIPDRLNMAVLTSTYYQQESGDTSGTDGKKSVWGVPGAGGELSLFYGGRVSEFAGFLSELGLAGGQTADTTGAVSSATGAAKLPILFPVGDARVGLVAYTGGQGAAYSFELLNTGAADTHKMMGNAGANKQHAAAAYAGSYLGTRVDATGLSVVANNSMGFLVLGQYAAAGPGTGNASTLPLTYIRAATTMDLAGWDAGFGIQNFSGDQQSLLPAGTGPQPVYAATIIDAQLQGELAGMETGFYVTYGTAPANANGNVMAGGWSTLNKGGHYTTTSKGAASSLNVATSVEVIHHVMTLQAAARMATIDNTGTNSLTDNAIMVGATYELAQNVELGLNYTTQSGTAWDEAALATGADARGKDMTTLLLEVLF